MTGLDWNQIKMEQGTHTCACASVVPRPSSAREERGRVWDITPGRSVPKECCARVIMTRNLAFVVLRAYKKCKLRSILLKCARARAKN